MAVEYGHTLLAEFILLEQSPRRKDSILATGLGPPPGDSG